MRVVRIAAEIGSINSLTYQYEENLEADSVTGTEQTVVPMGFDPQIMKITAIEKMIPNAERLLRDLRMNQQSLPMRGRIH